MNDTTAGKNFQPAHLGQTRALLICGAVAGPLFTLVWLAAGAVRAGYNPLCHPISSLALGESGWIQVASFIVTGLLTAAFAAGLRRALRTRGGSAWGPLFVGLVGIGLIGAGLFATDPISGYPPGTPDAHLAYSSVPAALHDLFSALVFFGLPLACFVFARRFAAWGRRGWAIYSTATGVSFLVTFVLAGAGFGQAEGLVDLGGLFQRISITLGWAWLTLLALHLLNAPSRGQAGSASAPK